MSITAEDLQAMVSHWLGCPPNGYLGSGYGSGIHDLLQTPLAGDAADQLIAKLRRDVPILGQLPEGFVNLYAEQEGVDRVRLVFEVAGVEVPVVYEPNRGAPTLRFSA